MNKGELVDAIASEANLSKTDAENALNAFITAIGSAVAGGDKVTLPRFGTFALSQRSARTGMNPQDARADTDPGVEEREVHRGVRAEEAREQLLVA